MLDEDKKNQTGVGQTQARGDGQGGDEPIPQQRVAVIAGIASFVGAVAGSVVGQMLTGG